MLKSTTVSPDKVTVVYSCEGCKKEERESIANISCDGPPMCTDCDIIMEMEHVIIDF